MNTFSFRAECPHDVEMFVAGCEMVGHPIDMQMQTIKGVPDVTGECQVDTSLHVLQNVLRGIEDSHVLVQSLRQVPLAQNSLERDHSIDWW